MKPSEILRNLADMIDAKEQSLSQPGALAPEIQPEEPVTTLEPEGDGSGLAQQPDDIFVPPLQLKIELLKKATGVENIYDDPENDDTSSNSYDELNAIRRNAGINPVVLDALGDDEPLDV